MAKWKLQRGSGERHGELRADAVDDELRSRRVVEIRCRAIAGPRAGREDTGVEWPAKHDGNSASSAFREQLAHCGLVGEGITPCKQNHVELEALQHLETDRNIVDAEAVATDRASSF